MSIQREHPYTVSKHEFKADRLGTKHHKKYCILCIDMSSAVKTERKKAVDMFFNTVTRPS